MTSAEYIETVTVGDERVPCARIMMLVPLTTFADLTAADLGSPTGVTPALARAVAVPIAAEGQRVAAQGKS